jgi:hypothetical protein
MAGVCSNSWKDILLPKKFKFLASTNIRNKGFIKLSYKKDKVTQSP